MVNDLQAEKNHWWTDPEFSITISAPQFRALIRDSWVINGRYLRLATRLILLLSADYTTGINTVSKSLLSLLPLNIPLSNWCVSWSLVNWLANCFDHMPYSCVLIGLDTISMKQLALLGIFAAIGRICSYCLHCNKPSPVKWAWRYSKTHLSVFE